MDVTWHDATGRATDGTAAEDPALFALGSCFADAARLRRRVDTVGANDGAVRVVQIVLSVRLFCVKTIRV